MGKFEFINFVLRNLVLARVLQLGFFVKNNWRKHFLKVFRKLLQVVYKKIFYSQENSRKIVLSIFSQVVYEKKLFPQVVY